MKTAMMELDVSDIDEVAAANAASCMISVATVGILAVMSPLGPAEWALFGLAAVHMAVSCQKS